MTYSCKDFTHVSEMLTRPYKIFKKKKKKKKTTQMHQSELKTKVVHIKKEVAFALLYFQKIMNVMA